jgi:phosphoglucomutase
MESREMEKAHYWASAEVFDPATRKEVLDLIEQSKYEDIRNRFYRDLEFGTGGLRGIMGAGTARMNVYNIRKATTAFARYLKKSFAGEIIKVGISYDSRIMAKEFAHEAARILAAHQIHALITEELRPVPILSFLVRQHKCNGGICVTASHNPPIYNGYKVYWNTGGQVVPPHDRGIIEEYNKIDKYETLPTGVDDPQFIHSIGKELDDTYFEELKKLSLSDAGKSQLKIVYTPLHGTAGKPLQRAFKTFGFEDVHAVKEQFEPDGRFPTVDFPNPEDIDALKMGIDLGDRLHADLVLGTDPDCDRVGIVCRNNDDKLEALNGNQIGCLLTEYVFSRLKERGELPTNPLAIKTIVTTELQGDIARHYGAHVENTLTGFKWICDLIQAYETGTIKPYRQYVCGGEESYGFLYGQMVMDKDGINACVLAAEMTAHYKSLGFNLWQVLDQIYLRHGVYLEHLESKGYPGADGDQKMKQVMQGLRDNPITELGGVAIIQMRDYLHDSLGLPKSNVLQYDFADGSKLSLRPSGTEPKLKVYLSVCEKNLSLGTEDAKVLCHQKKDNLLKCALRILES